MTSPLLHVLLPLAATLSLATSCLAVARLTRSWAWGVAAGWVAWLWVVVVTSELWGAFSLLTATTLVGTHLSVAIGAWLCTRRRPWPTVDLRPLRTVEGLTWCGVGLLLLVTVLVTAPNNPDALNYHLVKIDQWWSQGSLDHFATSYDPQVYLGPAAELAVLPFLTDGRGPVALAGLVQLGAWVACTAAAVLVARALGGSDRAQRLAALVPLIAPPVVSEAATAQNDLVVAAALTTAAAVVASSKAARPSAVLFLGVAVGVALATKATAAMALPGLAVWWVLRARRRSRVAGDHRRSVVLPAALVAATCLVLLPNLGWTARNLSTFGSPLGPPSRLTAPGPSVGGAAANVLRWAGSVVATPAGPVNAVTESAVAVGARALGQDADDARWVYGADRYTVDAQLNEDRNTWVVHAALLLVVLVGAAARRRLRPPGLLPLTLNAGAMMAIAATTLRWQPWGGRFLLPAVVLVGIAIALALDRWPRWTQLLVVAVLVLQCAPWVLRSTWRPLVPPGSVVTTSTQDELFAGAPALRAPMADAVDHLLGTGTSTIALGEGTYPNEYAIRWLVRRGDERNVRIVHVDATTSTARLGPASEPSTGLCLCDTAPGGSRTARFGPVLTWTAS